MKTSDDWIKEIQIDTLKKAIDIAKETLYTPVITEALERYINEIENDNYRNKQTLGNGNESSPKID